MSINTPRDCSVRAVGLRSDTRPAHLDPKYASVAPPRARTPSRLVITSALSDRGRSVKPEQLQVKTAIGEGSYGQVFEGWLDTQNGKERVVLKRVKNRVEGAAEMGQMEHLLNVYASKSARDSIAAFVGYSQVPAEAATRSLTEGLWLLWRFEGGKTLAHYLRRRDCIQQLAQDLGVSERAAVPTVMKQIFEGLAGLHAAGLVHRDVKPLNIIFAEQQRRFKLIDLGACADLRTGTNYTPDESILDPTYCPPEQYCMPTDSPHLAKQLKPLAVAMSPMLWSRYKPDRFDSYSSGLVLLQLAVPKLRSAAGIKQFNVQFKRSRFDLTAWRRGEQLPARETAVLDADNGAGWELAAALLRPRDIQVEDDGGVVFVNKGGAVRLPVKAALAHPFIRQAKDVQRADPAAAAAAPQPASETLSLVSSAVGFWNSARSKLKSLELQMSNQETAVAAQTGKVEVMKAEVAAGKLGKDVLDRQEGLLSKMTGRLNSLQSDFGATAASAQRAMSFLTPRDKLSNQARAVAMQTGKVKVLREAYATGKIKKGELDRQEGLLQKMTGRLGSLQDELNSTAASAQRLLGSFMSRGNPELEAGSGVQSSSQAAPRRLFNLMRSDRSEGSTGGKRPLTSGQSSQGSSGSSSRRSAPDGNIAPAEGGSSKKRGFRIFGGSQDRDEGSLAAALRSDTPPSLAGRQAALSAGRRTEKGASEPSPGEQKSLRDSAAGAAVTGIYAGLKLTGFALRVATDMATSLSKDANAAFAESDAQRAAKRAERAATNAFLEFLKEAEPPLGPKSQWSGLRKAADRDPRGMALSDDERQTVFAAYIAELAELEQTRRNRGEELFKELLADAGLQRDSTLAAVEARLRTDPRFPDLPGGLETTRLFAEAMESRVPEFDFWDLLRGCQDPPLSKDVSWGRARRQVVNDPRFEGISERQRRSIFRRYLQALEKPTAAPASVLPAASGFKAGGSVKQKSDAVEASRESLSSLQALRAEQARLKGEYEKMEAKLREMELKLKQSDGSDEKVALDLDQLARDINGKKAEGLLPRASR